MKFEITVLGSGTIIPSAERKPTSLMVEAEGITLLFELGPSVLQSMAEAGVSPYYPDAVFISHFHADHSLGIGHLIGAAANDPSFPEGRMIDLYGPRGTDDFVDRFFDLYPSLRKARGLLGSRGLEEGDEVRLSKVTVRVGKASHGGARALAFRVSCGGKLFCYTGDTSYSDGLADFLSGADILAAECSFPEGYPSGGHMNPQEAGRLAAESGARRLLVVHMYPFLSKETAVETIAKEYEGEIIPAADGMKIVIGE